MADQPGEAVPLNLVCPHRMQFSPAILTGFARGERVTIPSLHDETLWNHYEQARQAMMPHLGNDTPAERYLSLLTH